MLSPHLREAKANGEMQNPLTGGNLDHEIDACIHANKMVPNKMLRVGTSLYGLSVS
jgi:hypothetical protein